MTTPTEAPREALPDLDPKRMLGYDAIRYVAGYPESYVKEYAASLLESERQAHASEVERLRGDAERSSNWCAEVRQDREMVANALRNLLNDPTNLETAALARQALGELPNG